LTGAPIVVNNKVIVGNAGGELGVRGWVQALDLATGKALWKAYNTGPDADVMIGRNFHAYYSKDQGVDLGATTWPSSMWRQGGATSWAWLTYDPALNLLFYGTANPGVWNPDMRPGDNKWASSIIARDPDTGQAVWAYQLVGHDGWDYDAVNESIVADLPIGGALRKVIVHFNKNGFAYTIDRSTGQVLVANPFRQQTWTTGIDLSTGIPAVANGYSPHQGQTTHNICPSPLGGKDWEPAAFSLKTGLFYIPSINVCDDLEPLLTEYIAGTPFWGANFPLHPGPGGYQGELIAWNAAAGARAWSVKEPLPVYSGVLATAGNVVFYGTLDKHFKAVNATTGQVLFDKVLECGIVSNPMSYTAPDGKQRIAVMTGVGWFAGNVVGGGTCPPTGGGDAPLAGPTSGYVHVFKLP
jgi:alcohol dehydrogenase (cytochrome c)